MKLIFIAASFLATVTTQAHLIEDGAAFSAKYRILDASCFLPVPSYSAEPGTFITEIEFRGTPEGLVVNGQLVQIGEAKTFQHGGGFTTTSGFARYLSPDEFTDSSAMTINGITKTTTETYSVNEATGELIKSTRENSSEGTSSETICHFQRL